MMDDRFDEMLREAAQEYNRPPDNTPRDLMWARIQAVRRERARRRQRLQVLRSPWVRWSMGIAAALVIGIAIGRYAGENGGEPQVVTRPEAAAPADREPSFPNLALQLATTQHLSRAEAILTSFRVDPEIGQMDPQFFFAVRQLLTSTRLLLGSPAAADPAVRELLEDLELMLAQISQVSYDNEVDLDVIDEGMESSSLLPRLRSAIPAGRFAAGA